jgi:hypothetical protein
MRFHPSQTRATWFTSTAGSSSSASEERRSMSRLVCWRGEPPGWLGNPTEAPRPAPPGVSIALAQRAPLQPRAAEAATARAGLFHWPNSQAPPPMHTCAMPFHLTGRSSRAGPHGQVLTGSPRSSSALFALGQTAWPGLQHSTSGHPAPAARCGLTALNAACWTARCGPGPPPPPSPQSTLHQIFAEADGEVWARATRLQGPDRDRNMRHTRHYF